MRRASPRAWACLWSLLGAGSAVASLGLAGCGGCEGTRVEVRSPDGAPVVEVCAREVRTADERMRGLRGGDPLGPDDGLLLVFPVADEVCITNEGVAFPIDLVFVNGAGRLVAVEREVPAGDALPRCHSHVQQVLEVQGGVAAGAQSGDLLVARP